MENNIKVNKYVYFDTTYGRYYLTSEASEIIYRRKNLICSYSGANEWVHHFICEMLDLCSGQSIYNYALGCYKHENEIERIFKENKESVTKFIQKTTEEQWSKTMYKLIENIIDEVETV